MTAFNTLAEQYLRAKTAARKGDITLLRNFWNKRLALPWREYVEDFKVEITRSGYRMGELWAGEGGNQSYLRSHLEAD